MTIQDQVSQLYVEARDDVYRYLLTLNLSPGPAQEAVQEVFLRLFVALSKGEEIRNPRAWIFRVAHNFGLNVRAREAAWRPFDTNLEANLRDGRTAPETGAIERQQRAMLKEALDQLSPQQRQCLHLRAEGLRYHEIAETLGISTSTVGEFLGRALRRLRKVVHE